MTFDDLGGTYGNFNGINICLESLQIKTRVSPRMLGKSIEHVPFDQIFCSVGGEVFHQQVPIEQKSQVMN